MSLFGENLRRLLGVHDLRAGAAAGLLDVSPQALSEWTRGKRHPNLETLMRVARFFEVPPERLLQSNFADLLERELSDPGRFRRVEAKIGRTRRNRASRNTPRKKSA